MIHTGNCLEWLATLEAKSVDHVITDPPYSEHVTSKSRRATEFCFACEEPIETCTCTGPCPGCGAKSGYTCRSDCPIMTEYCAMRAREEAMDLDDWDDPSPEKEGFEDVEPDR